MRLYAVIFVCELIKIQLAYISTCTLHIECEICVRYIFFNVYFAAEIKNKHCWKMK